MECCKQSQPAGEKEPRGNKWKHFAMMLGCCLLPLGVVFLLNAINYEGVGSYLVFLLCPLTHLLMMKAMKPGKGEAASGGDIGK